MEQRTIERVLEAIAVALGVDRSEVNMDSTEDTVDGWDSAGIINLLMTVESEFDVHLSQEDAEDLRSVKLVLEVLEERGLK